MRISHLLAIMLALSTSVGLTACNKKEGEKNTQVVAKVNSDEITVSQLNFYLQRLGKLDEAQQKQATQQVVTTLVNEQLLLQQAKETKLDRDPRVIELIEKSKNDILARAVMERKMADVKPATDAQIKDFYDKNPALFQDRKLYQLQEWVISAGRDKVSALEAGLNDKASVNAVNDWLKSNGYQFTSNPVARATEQLPMELVPIFNKMKSGDITVVPKDNTINVVMQLSAESQPISLERAKPLIQQFIGNQTRQEVERKTLDELRKSAKIEYMSTIKPIMDAANTAAPATSPTPATETTSKPDAAAPDTKDSKIKSDELNKGIKGL